MKKAKLGNQIDEKELARQCAIHVVVESASDETPLKQCMMGRDAECWHPKCPITMEDAENGKYCTLPLYDYRQ